MLKLVVLFVRGVAQKMRAFTPYNIGTEELKILSVLCGLKTPSYCLTLVELGNYLFLFDNGYSEYVDI